MSRVLLELEPTRACDSLGARCYLSPLGSRASQWSAVEKIVIGYRGSH